MNALQFVAASFHMKKTL